jgi:UDP-glucose 4-epimerase
MVAANSQSDSIGKGDFMRVLVTGGAGFIGSRLVDHLLSEGHHVRVLDDFSTGKPENLPQHEALTIQRGDVGDYATVEHAMQGIQWVFHEAAIASVPRTVADPLAGQRTNYQGTLNVLEAARRQGVKRVVFAASAAAYGDLPVLPKAEDMAVKPLSPYAVDKLASEYACQVYARLYGLETVCLRYFNVFGPRQYPSSPYSGVISIFAERLARAEQPTIFGDGEQTRDFIFVADVVEANLRAVQVTATSGRVINVATGNKVTLNALLKMMSALLGQAFAPVYAEARTGDIRDSWASIARANELLDWQPRHTLEAGLRQLLDVTPLRQD